MKKNLIVKLSAVAIAVIFMATTIVSAVGQISIKAIHMNIDNTTIEKQVKDEPQTNDKNIITLNYFFDQPVTSEKKLDKYLFNCVTVNGLVNDNNPGLPSLPYKPVSLLLERGSTLDYIEIIVGEEKTLGDNYIIMPGQEIIHTENNKGVLSEKNEYEYIIEETQLFTAPDPVIYSSSEIFPSIMYTDTAVHSYKGYTILTFNVYPVIIIPKSGSVFYYTEMIVNVHTKPAEFKGIDYYRGLHKDQTRISNLVENVDALTSYPLYNLKMDKTYEYVIITTEHFKGEFQVLADWKMNRAATTQYENINVKIVLLQDIINNPDFWWDGVWGDGVSVNFNDTQCHIRNFIKMAYLTWNTDFVLLGGDADVNNNNDLIIPHRGVRNDIPCDMYYGCLDGNWDTNMNGIWGENAGEYDLFAEVYIGRAPVDDTNEVMNFVSKTIAYEQAADANKPYLKKALMLGDNLDSKTEAGNSKDLVTDIIPQYTTKKAYTRDGTNCLNFILSEMQQGVHIVNHEGHGYNYGFQGIDSNDVLSLTNTDFFLVYSVGCYTASFDNKLPGGSYIDDDSIGELFVTASGGAFAYIGNSRYGWYISGTTEGYGSKYDQSFFQTIMNNHVSLGEALQYSKQNLMVQGTFHAGTYFTLNLLGDPETQIKTTFSSPTADFSSVTGYLLTPPSYRGIVDIKGTARKGDIAGSTFSHYVLEYGQGLYPDDWNDVGISLIDNGYIEVTDDVIGSWDTSVVVDGTYTMRLTVYDMSGVSSMDWHVVIVNKTYIQSPCNNDFYKKGEILDIVGSVDATNFLYYTLEYGLGTTPSIWYSQGISLNQGGNLPVIDGLLATWDTNYVTANDYYTLRLSSHYYSHVEYEERLIFFDNRFKEGWPQRISHAITSEGIGVVDINNDNMKEVFVCAGDTMYAWRQDGTSLEGWPQSVFKATWTTPAFGDINGDGNLEIVCTGVRRSDLSYIYAWNHDGTCLSGWPSSYDSIISGAVTLADMNNDGSMEIIFIAGDKLHVLNQYGDSYSSDFPVILTSTASGSAAVGDLNRDGFKEIVVGLTSGAVVVVYQNGSFLQIDLIGLYCSPPSLADFNNDGKLEIVISTNQKLYVLNHDGSVFPGWPQSFSGDPSASIAIADLKGDGCLEIIVNGKQTDAGQSLLGIFHYNGEYVQGSWPKLIPGAIGRSPVVADIDGDLRQEILIVYGSDKLGAWHHDGKTVNGWPKIMPLQNKFQCSPVLVDIDLNSKLDIIIGSYNHILIWDSNRYSVPGTIGWSSFHNGPQNTGKYLPVKLQDYIYVNDQFSPFTPGWGVTHFNCIQDGVDAVNEHGIVYVFNGRYTENVFISKPITLQSLDQKNTILQPSSIQYAILTINSNNVIIRGFTISGSMSSPGIFIHSVNSCIIENNIIKNSQVGILFELSSNNIVSSNTIIDNFYGISLIEFSNDNLIFNNYLNNTCNAYDNAINYWNSDVVQLRTNIIGGPFIAGNYWSDYTGFDSNYDGLGDTPFFVSEKNQDSYPLMDTWSTQFVFVDDDYTSLTLGWGYNHFDSIQHGINVVEEHGVVFVNSGTYAGNLQLDKPFELRGEDKKTTIISAGFFGVGSLIAITSDNVNISGFTLFQGYIGVNLEGSQWCSITDNVISHCTEGIKLISSSNNHFSENIIEQSNKGINIDSLSHNNNFYHNDFINNQYPAFDDSTNFWYNLFIEQGNYWSDYTGVDEDGDGIGDSPYFILGDSEMNMDMFPLMDPFNSRQTLVLYEGWNLISFNVVPSNLSLSRIMKPLIDQGILEVMKDGGMGVLWPSFGIDTIGELDVTKGFKVKVTQDSAFELRGLPVQLPVSVELQEGWNLIGYPVSEAVDAMSVIQPLIDDEVLVQVVNSCNQKIYFNGLEWVNGIGDFNPGQGYYIKVFSECLLHIDFC